MLALRPRYDPHPFYAALSSYEGQLGKDEGMAKSRQSKLSPELQAMLRKSEQTRKSTPPSVSGVNARLERAANRKLAKSGYFPKREINPETPLLDADSIGTHGLKPTWHGRV